MPTHYIQRISVTDGNFNSQAILPLGLRLSDVKATLTDVHELVYNLNTTLYRQAGQRLEDIMMPATFSGLLSEVIVRQLAKHSTTLTRNLYHNGHPDLIPTGQYPGNAVQYGHDGLEIKTSRYASGWQGHNPEKIWIMIFRYYNDPHQPEKDSRLIESRAPFQLVEVLAAELEKSDWSAQGRRPGSRRTPTASIVASGTAKLRANWVYQIPNFRT